MPPLGVIYTSVAVAADSQNVLLFFQELLSGVYCKMRLSVLVHDLSKLCIGKLRGEPNMAAVVDSVI